MKLLALDYGAKRTGIAATDDLQIIASGLTTVDTATLDKFLADYLGKNKVEALVVGEPRYMDGKAMDIESDITAFINKFKTMYPEIPVYRVDERFTSKMAMQTMVSGGVKKKDRGNKQLVDTISATIILQSFMESRR